MKMLNQLRMVAVLLIGTLVPVSLQAKAEVDLKGILAPATAQFGGQAAEASGTAILAKQMREAEEAITTNREELKLRDKSGSLTEAGDKIKMNDDLISAYVNKKANDEKEKRKEMESLLAKSAGPSEGVSGSDTDNSGIHAACQVDLSEFKSLDGQMRSEPVSFLKREGAKIIAEKKKEEKENDLKKVMALFSKWEKNNAERNNEEVEPAAIDEMAHLDLNKPEGLTDAKRIERLKEDVAKKEAKNVKDGQGLIKRFKEMFMGMAQADEKDIGQWTGPFVKNLQDYRQALEDSASDLVKKEYAKCEEQAKQVGRDQPLSPASALNKAYQVVVAYYNGDATQYADSFLQQLSAEARVMQCTKLANKVESKLGASMRAKIASLEGNTEPEAFLQGALGVMADLGKAAKDVGKKLKKPAKDCSKLAELKDKIENFVGTTQQHIQQAGQQQQGQKPGMNQMGSSNRQQPAANPAHSGQQQQPRA